VGAGQSNDVSINNRELDVARWSDIGFFQSIFRALPNRISASDAFRILPLQRSHIKTEIAILLAANLKGRYRLGYKEVGSVLEHAAHIENEGAVLWNIVVPGARLAHSFAHPGIKTRHFYNVSDKAVTHVFDIEYIESADQIKKKKGIYRFLLTPRKIGWKKWRDSFYWMKITNIYRLKRAHRLHDFGKYKDGRPLLIRRNYVIITDPHFQHYNKSIKRREIMSDYIGDLLRPRLTPY